MIVQASAANPPPLSERYEDRMEGPDRGLINAWLAGRAKARESPELATRARNGELPMLPYRGGVDKAIKTRSKVGSLLYVAMWQGLRGEDLCIDMTAEPTLACSRFGVPVTYTLDISKMFGSTATDEGEE